jgi:hypothetical protein
MAESYIHVYKIKEELSSPTLSPEAVFLTSVINAQERRKVITIDIPGAFIHANMDKLIHMHLETCSRTAALNGSGEV